MTQLPNRNQLKNQEVHQFLKGYLMIQKTSRARPQNFKSTVEQKAYPTKKKTPQ